MTFGDSLAEISLPTALRQRLQALGFQPEMLGTTLSGQWRGQQDRTEARGGKRITDLLYLRPLSAADDNTVEPLPLGAEARYLALPATGMHMLSRKHYNPFLRRATGANLDGSAIDHNLIVKSLNTGFVGLSQTVTLGGTEARIVGFVSGAYGGVGVYRLDRSVSAYSGNIISTECARCVANGEVFDVRFYLQRFGLSDPDWIIISAGTNDFLNLMHGANGLADLAQVVRFGVDRLHGAFRLALPEAHIVFFNAALGSNPQFRSFEPNHRLLMRVTRDAVKQSADPLSHWINAAIWQSESSDWSIHPAGQDLEAEANTIADLIATVQAEWPSSIGQSRGISTSRKMPSSK
ncbi:SGNH/GDSL hydrolase family protein [Novosphingobium sediminicola]|uniref:Uncharacterized protein n=1 Tax=Novosphingobium sediminicola TaxID=563162 RepID=A0A7W6CJD4_9SPHN|nr:SGNH/GDSL hydrolase family protein [Novosphingobium sediminicola]MBB3955523.1 hypothetical protein [Novosphingobium sediminicola]